MRQGEDLVILDAWSHASRRVATSTNTAEAYSLEEALDTGLNTKWYLESLGWTVHLLAGTDCSDVVEDVTAPVGTTRAKGYHLLTVRKLRELYGAGEFTLAHIPTHDMPADCFTKPLGGNSPCWELWRWLLAGRVPPGLAQAFLHSRARLESDVHFALTPFCTDS
jgi:hypothetical protein